MRADRLVSLVLLLRQRGRLSATALACELEVSTRTVLRDIEALSTAGVPVFAERGRHGGFELLPGFRTELTGLNHDEALALLTAGSGRGEQVFGLGAALASAMRKVVDALPEGHRTTASDAARRILIEPEADLLARRQVTEDISGAVMSEVRGAVLRGHRLRIHYAAADREPAWRTVDPIGLVTVRDRGYLLATVSGADRTYRLSRILHAEELAEIAQRPQQVDLERIWQERSIRFRTGGDQIVVVARVEPARREELVSTALAVSSEVADTDGRLRLEMAFQDARHAEWALWQLGTDAEVLEPESVRAALRRRATELARLYRDTGDKPIRG
ncbi:helix-turn-helix transcriptional regulator [Microbacterium aurantiacum]|uniref:helix-turn-helix transcriptional regulator n=1 Tax=Microbacterium aurantiacum TaxID=162393 RepID=UPI000C80ED0D|nr:WYL domain-containing protein [Microbacterium aurantiacum]